MSDRRAAIVKELYAKHPNRIEQVAAHLGVTVRTFKRSYISRMATESLAAIVGQPDCEPLADVDRRCEEHDERGGE